MSRMEEMARRERARQAPLSTFSDVIFCSEASLVGGNELLASTRDGVDIER